MAPPLTHDLYVLVADLDTESAVKGFLWRPEALAIRPITITIRRHPNRDPGCRLEAHEFLRPFIKQYEYALVMFDRQGCGQESLTREALEQELEDQLFRNGWQDRAAVIVPDPELESWIWSDSKQVDRVCGWSGRIPELRHWLRDQEYLPQQGIKPERPKEAFRAALREVQKTPSAALFRQLAERVSLQRCTDPAFGKLRETLQRWFPLNY